MAPLVNNPLIASASLHVPCQSLLSKILQFTTLTSSLVPLYLHTYVWPFAIIWPVFLRYFLTPSLYDKYIGGPEWTFVWCGTIITAQSLVWLSTNWNVNLKALFTSVKAKTVADATLVKVLPVVNAGASEICIIDRDNVQAQRPQLTLSYVADQYNLGWGQAKRFVPLPKASISLRPRQ
jgi:cation-transporting ATPase 13A1